MHLEPFAALLEQKGVGRQAKDIFINAMRVEDMGIMLKGDSSGTPIDMNLPGLYRGKFALVVRAKNYASGKALMDRAMAAIWIEQETDLGAIFVNYARPRTLPINYPVPVSGVVEFVVNIDACYVVPV
jgi:hypothetical protein